MPTVYVTQIPVHKDKETKAIIPAINISPANEYGEIKTLFPSRMGIGNMTDIINQLKDKLYSYDASKGDTILPLGDPVLSAVTFSVLSLYNKEYAVLKWDKKLKKYCKISVEF
jgi:hypothetical protein